MKKLTRPPAEALKRYFLGSSLPGEVELIELYLSTGEDELYVKGCMAQAWNEMEAEGIAPAETEQDAWNRFIEMREKYRAPAATAPSSARHFKLDRWVKYAAAILGLVIAGELAYQILHNSGRGEQAHYTIYNASPGHGWQVSLSDGSTVTLFPGSVLRVPEGFGRHERRVLLSGRGYFNVQHNDAIPFYTEASGLVIKDIGTSFEVNVSGSVNKVLLKEGKISVHDGAKALADLHPGQGMEYHPHSARYQVVPFDTAAAFSWLQGELNYELAPLDEICKDLQDWYGVRIQISDEKLRKKRITVQFAGITIDRVMEILSKLSDFNYQKTGNDIFIR